MSSTSRRQQFARQVEQLTLSPAASVAVSASAARAGVVLLVQGKGVVISSGRGVSASDRVARGGRRHRAVTVPGTGMITRRLNIATGRGAMLYPRVDDTRRGGIALSTSCR